MNKKLTQNDRLVLNRRDFVRIASAGTAGLAIGCAAPTDRSDDGEITFDLPDDGGTLNPLQLTPTGTYWLTAVDDWGNRTSVMGIVSLGSAVITTKPSFAWTQNKEHYFARAAATDLASILSSAAKIEIEVAHNGFGVPDKEIISFAQALIDESARFQAYGKPVLSPSDWVPGAPTYGTKAYYFDVGDSDPGRARILFDIDESDVGEIARLVWITEDDSVTDYFTGAADGTKLALLQKTLGDIPTTGVYGYEIKHY